MRKTSLILFLLMLASQNLYAQFDVHFGQTSRYLFWPYPEAYPMNESKDYSDGRWVGAYGETEYSIFNPFNFTHSQRDSAITIYGFAVAAAAGTKSSTGQHFKNPYH